MCLTYIDLVFVVAVFMGTLAYTIDDAIAAALGQNMKKDANGNKTDEIDLSYEPSYYRYIALVGVCLLVILPLCLFKDMKALAKLSFIGTFANIVVLVCIIISACQHNPRFDANVHLMGQYANNATLNTNQRYIDMFDYDLSTQKYKPQRKLFDLKSMFPAYGTFSCCFAVGVIAPVVVAGMKRGGGIE